jgi:3-carboxy-cis,cis-muconate cycloisomerase
MPLRIIDSLATSESLADLFSDRQVLQAMLDFEAALARAEAIQGVVPLDAARTIGRAAVAENFDAASMARQAQRAGTPAIPLVKALTERVRATEPDAARFVHWGATSQDVTDTALVLLLKRARALLASDHERLLAALRRLAEQHEHTVMLGRTLLQPAPPVTFGLKAAGWYAAVKRGWSRIDTRFAEGEALQFGGASGTLAALGDRGDDVGRALAEELGLRYPDAPWHTQRDSLAALLAACGVQCGTLGKMARDIALLMQGEVGEAAEAGGEGRGGSSTMPHKRNPVACSLALASANRVPGLLASFLTAMVEEHERGVGGWHAEWPIVTSIVQALGLAVESMAEAAEGLTVNPARMRTNIESTHGVIFAERVMMLLGEALGRDVAHQLLEVAARKTAAENRQFVDVLADMPEVTQVIAPATLRTLDAPEDYLGMAAVFQKRLLGE